MEDKMEGMIEFTTMNELHIGHCMIIKEKPCKITELNISKTGKHGCAKAVVTGKDIFTDKKYTCTFATSDKVQVPVIKTLAYQLNNIDDGYMDLMDENNDGKISDSEVLRAIDILEKAKKQKDLDRNINLLNYFDNFKN